jgi:hypothetical protein
MTDDIRDSAIANLELMFSQICDVLDISREELYEMVYEVMEYEEEVIH